MRVHSGWYAASVVSGLLALTVASNAPSLDASARPLAAPDGGCAGTPDPFGLLIEHSPGIEEKGIPHDAAEVRIAFARPLDQSTVNDRSIRLGVIDAGGRFRPVPIRLTLSRDGQVVTFRPESDLLMGVYYHVRLLGGAGGLGTQDCGPLPEGYRWRFATGLVFGAADDPVRPTTRNWMSCDLPTEATRPSDVSGKWPVIVNVFQSACNAPLLRGKTTLIRAYAPWWENPEIDDENELLFFDADVVFVHGSNTLAQVFHRFYRPDLLLQYWGLAITGQNTANHFGWKPAGGPEEPAEVSVEIYPYDAVYDPYDPSVPRHSPGRRAFEWADILPEFEKLELWFFTFDVTYDQQGTGRRPAVAVGSTAVTQLAKEVIEYAEQNLPTLDATFKKGGKVALKGTRTPIEDGPDETCGIPGCPAPRPITRAFWSQAPAGTHSSVTVAEDLAESMAREAFLSGLMSSTSRNKVVVGVIPDGLLGPNTVASTVVTSLGRVILTPPKGVEALLHEVGHGYGLQHCPFDACACYCGGGCRGQRCLVEGYRLDQEPGSALGWNKSMTEGNGEGGGDLAGLMEAFMVRKVHETNKFDNSHTAAKEERFVSQGSYQALLKEFSGQPAPSPVPMPWLEMGSGYASVPLMAEPRVPVPIADDVCPLPEDAGALDLLRTPLALEDRSRPRVPGRVDDRLRYEPPAPQSPVVLVTGIAAPDGTSATIISAGLIETPHPVPTQDLESAGGLGVVAIDREGTILETVPIMIPTFEPLHEDWLEDDPRIFAAVLAASPAVASVAIVADDGRSIDMRERSTTPPDVRLTRPSSGDRLRPDDRIRWEGFDPDGDALVYELEARSAPAEEWVTLEVTTANEVRVADIQLHPGPAPEIRVVADDGFDRTESAAIHVEIQRPPLAVSLIQDTLSFGVDHPLRVTFSTTMDPSTIDERSFQVIGPRGASLPGRVSLEADGRTARFQPDVPLDHAARYTLHVRSTVQDVWGNRLDGDRSWGFRTGIDAHPPFVTESLPAPGALTVEPTAPVRVLYSEPLDPSTVNSSTVRVLQNGAALPGTVTWDAVSNALTFEPTSPFGFEAAVEVTIDGVTDLGGNPQPEPYVFGFTIAGHMMPVEALMRREAARRSVALPPTRPDRAGQGGRS